MGLTLLYKVTRAFSAVKEINLLFKQLHFCEYNHETLFIIIYWYRFMTKYRLNKEEQNDFISVI